MTFTLANLRRTLASCVLATLAAVALPACSPKPATQLFIGVATDMDAPVPLQMVQMRLERFVDEARDWVPVDSGDNTTEWRINGPDNQYELPGSLVAFAGEGAPKIRITLNAMSSGRPFIRRSAVVRLVPEKTIFMRLGLTSRCVENADCPDQKTCIEGRCVEPEIKSAALSAYEASRQPEYAFECDSGTVFRNTKSKEPLGKPGAACAPHQICLEGTCYDKEAWGDNLPQPQALTVVARVSDPAGVPVPGASLRVEDGPITLVRRVRTREDLRGPEPPATSVPADEPGLHTVQLTTDPLTKEVRLTATAPGFVPQVVSIPFKAGVSQYVVPVVLFPLQEATLAAGESRPLMLEGGGRTATLELGPSPGPVTVRYGLVDGRFAPGQGVRASSAGLLQASAVLYLEETASGTLPAGTRVTFGTASTPPVVGAEGTPGAYLLDLQGTWQPKSDATVPEEARGRELRPASAGFWTVANHTARPSCLRGRVLRPDGRPCPGARARVWGPEGVGAFDSTAADGSFCAAAAQRDAAIISIGNTSRVVYMPATAGAAAACTQSDACVDIGALTLASDADCAAPPVDVARRLPVGAGCERTIECGALASCYQGFCVGESLARVSVLWSATSDFDLHVRAPGGAVIYERVREVKGIGRMDVEQCARECTGDKHLENVVLFAPGTYEAWVENFGGAAAGTAELEVLIGGVRNKLETLTVPGTRDGKSEVVSFTVP